MNQHNIDAYLKTNNFFLEVHFADRSTTFFPQFTVKNKGVRSYTDNITSENIKIFNGWRPYRITSVPVFTSKTAFKDLLKKEQIPTPRYELTPEEFSTPFVVKQSISSFGLGVKGPFLPSAKLQFELLSDDYCEEFLAGDILKMWYVGGKVACVESMSMPEIVGDGVSSIKNLIESEIKQKQLAPFNDLQLERLSQVLAFSGKKKSDVLAEGERQLIDFRYITKLRDIDEWPKEQLKSPAFLPQISKIGDVCQAVSFRETNIKNFIYTVDAILLNDIIYVLEANSNPIVHPAVYPVVINALMES